jgi:hypothetical protein
MSVCIVTFQDLMLLVESGLLTTQNAFTMSNMILGLDFKHAGAQVSDKYREREQYITPVVRHQIMAQQSKVMGS